MTKTHINKYIIIIGFLLCTSITAIAQNKTQIELATWSVVQLDFDLPKKWSASINQQLRTISPGFGFDNTFTEAEFEKKLLKEVALGIGFRHIWRSDIDDGILQIERLFRWHLQGSYEFEYEMLEFEFRYRTQRRNELGVTKDEGDYPRMQDRYRFAMTYKFDDFKIRSSVELFRRSQVGTIDGFSDTRWGIAFNYKFDKRKRIDLIYYSELTNEIWEPTFTNIFVARFRYRIDLD